MPDRETIVWKVVSLGFGAAAGFGAERVVSMVWKLVAHQSPPSDSADRRNAWPETIAWAAAVGVEPASLERWPTGPHPRCGKSPPTIPLPAHPAADTVTVGHRELCGS